MKKLAVTAILALSLMMVTACSNKSAADTDAKTSAPAETEISAEAEPEISAEDEADISVDEPETQDAAAEEEKMTVEEFAQTDEVQSEIESVASTLPEGWTFELYGEGDALVYAYNSPTQIEDDMIDVYQQGLDEEFTDEKMGDTFSSVISVLETVTTAEDPAVIVRYLNPDGTVVWEKIHNPE